MALTLFQELETRRQMGRTLVEMGKLAVDRSQLAQARDYFSQAITLFSEMGVKPDVDRVRAKLTSLV
jgi:hypothetical protein